MHETFFLTAFLAERLYHAGGAQYFVHHRQGGAFHFLDLTRLATHPEPVGPRHQKNGRRHRQGNNCQLPVDPRRHVDHRQEGEGRGEKRDHAIDDDFLHGRRVILNPVGRIGRALSVVVGKRKPLHMTEQLGAKAPQQFFARVSRQQRVGKVTKLRQHRHANQQSDRQRQQTGG